MPEVIHRCKRCLLSEFDPDFYAKSVAECIERIPEDKRTNEADYRSRLAVCSQCDMLREGMCAECGCFIELRAAKAWMNCPTNKWRVRPAAIRTD